MSESTPGSQKKGVAREANHSSQGNSQQMQFGILYPSTSLAGDRPSNKAPGTIEENKNIRTETKAEETQDNGVNQSDESASKQQNNSRSKPDASARRKQRNNPSSLGDPHDGSIVKPVTEKDQDSDGHKTMKRSTLYETHTQSKFTNRSSYNDKSIQPKLKYTGKGPPKVLHGNNNQQSAASVRQSGRSKHAILQGDASSYGSAFDTSAGSDKLKSNGEYEISKQGRVWCIRDLKTNKLTTLKTIKADEVFFESKELVSVDGVFHQLIVHNGKKPKLEIAERSSSSEDERKPNACDFSYGSKSDDYSETRTTPNSLPESEEPSSRFQKQSHITRTENAMEYMKPGAGTDLFKETEAEETQSSDVNQSDERVSKQQNNARSKYADVSARPKRSLYEGDDRGQASPSYNPGSTGGTHDGSTEQPGKPRVTGTGQETEAEETQGSGVNRSNEKAGKQQNSSRSKPDDASARQKGSSDDGGQPSPRYNPGSTGDSHDRSTEQPGKPPVNETGQETEAEETQGSGVNQSDERAGEKQNNSHSNPDYASKRKKQGQGDGGDGGQPSPRYYSWPTGGSHDGSTEQPGKPPITGTAQETECKTQGNLFLKPPTPPPRKSKMQGAKTVDNPQTTNMQRTLHTEKDKADIQAQNSAGATLPNETGRGKAKGKGSKPDGLAESSNTDSLLTSIDTSNSLQQQQSNTEKENAMTSMTTETNTDLIKGKGLGLHRGNDPLQPERTECVPNVESKLDDGCKDNQNPMDESEAEHKTQDLQNRNNAHSAADSENKSSANVVSSDRASEMQAVKIKHDVSQGEPKNSKWSDSQKHFSEKSQTNGTYTFVKDGGDWFILDAKSDSLLTVLTKFHANEIYFKGRHRVFVDEEQYTIKRLDDGQLELKPVHKQAPASKKDNGQLQASQNSLSTTPASFQSSLRNGDQPYGSMNIYKLKVSCNGYPHNGSIAIAYKFQGGKQEEHHPNPGAWYKGITRTAYLPDNRQGRTVCQLLKEAFRRKLIFTIGRSRTTGHEGVILWNDIHHKTDHRPNTQFSYPDSTYLSRVTEELAAKGVTGEQIKTKGPIEDFIEL